MVVYKITNIQNGMSYIGKDQNENDWYMGSGIYLWNAYRKYFDNYDLNENTRSSHRWVYRKNSELNLFKKEILCRCDNAKELCQLEKKYIKLYNTIRPNGYNIAVGGEGGNLVAGYSSEERKSLNEKISKATKEAMKRPEVREKFMASVTHKSEQWRAHISESLKGKPTGRKPSDETIEKMRNRMKGNSYGIGNKSRTGQHLSNEQKKKISEFQKQNIHTKEWNMNVSNALRGVPKSEAHKAALRKPKPKYRWLLPSGEIRIMDTANAIRHPGWIKLEENAVQF